MDFYSNYPCHDMPNMQLDLVFLLLENGGSKERNDLVGDVDHKINSTSMIH